MHKPFKFKQFTVNQDKCAMKVGTDGVLLGAWASINHSPSSILDIGTGSGLLALQMAQRSQAVIIDAVEIEALSYEQAVENFENSSWADRLFCYHASLSEFTLELNDEYDLILSNPPFYSENYLSPDPARNKARFNSSLTYKELLNSVAQLLSEKGVFATIIPNKEEKNFLLLASKIGLYPTRICRVKGHSKALAKRSLMELSSLERPHNEMESSVQVEELILEIKRHQYTPEYLELVKDFYLKA